MTDSPKINFGPAALTPEKLGEMAAGVIPRVECAVCGADDWATQPSADSPYMPTIQAISFAGSPDGAPQSFGYVFFSCKTCGYTRIHSLGAIYSKIIARLNKNDNG